MTVWSGEPAYKQVAKELRARIYDGGLEIGSQLPSIADLMRHYDVSITVIRMALSELRSEGLIDSHQGKGSFVKAQPTDAAPPDRSPEFEGIMRLLDQVHNDVRRLDKRLDRLEQAVQPQPRQRSPRRARDDRTKS